MRTSKGGVVLSIIIRTRNRTAYTRSSIRNVLCSPSSDLELVVQDNSSDEELDRFVSQSVRDPRLKHNYVHERLYVIENFTRGLPNAHSEYVAFIGDNDGVSLDIVDAALWVREEGFDALLPTRPAQYWWSDLRFRHYGDRFSGSLDIRPFTGRVAFPLPETELHRCVKSGGQKLGSLPRVYYGLVRRRYLEKVRDRTGSSFPGPSLDLAGAVTVASFVKRMVQVDYPLFIPGSSYAGTAGMGARKAHIGRLEDQPIFSSVGLFGVSVFALFVAMVLAGSWRTITWQRKTCLPPRSARLRGLPLHLWLLQFSALGYLAQLAFSSLPELCPLYSSWSGSNMVSLGEQMIRRGICRVCIITTIYPPFDTFSIHKQAKPLARPRYDARLITQHETNETVDTEGTA